MRRIFALIMAVGLMAAVMASPGTALARAEFTEYTGVETQIGGGPIFDGVDLTKPVVQFDLDSVFEDVTTDPRASGTTYVSGKLTVKDMATFSGTMHGTSLTVVTGNGYEGTWEGTWQGELINGVGFFKAVAHGTGDLAGLLMKAEFTGNEAFGPVNIEGRILDPHGA
jgi:hypothetical protein